MLEIVSQQKKKKKKIGDLKNGENRIFFRIFGVNKGSLWVFAGALRVPNFFVTSLCVRNCIPTIKLLAISKSSKIEFVSYFRSK